jgi:hypothetical protein
MPTKKKKLTFGIKEFFACTPQMLRRVGNTMLGISSLGGSFAFLADDKRFGLGLLAFGVMGKFFTEFFSEEGMHHEEEVCDEDESTEPTVNEDPKPAAPLETE